MSDYERWKTQQNTAKRLVYTERRSWPLNLANLDITMTS